MNTMTRAVNLWGGSAREALESVGDFADPLLPLFRRLLCAPCRGQLTMLGVHIQVHP